MPTYGQPVALKKPAAATPTTPTTPTPTLQYGQPVALKRSTIDTEPLPGNPITNRAVIINRPSERQAQMLQHWYSKPSVMRALQPEPNTIREMRRRRDDLAGVQPGGALPPEGSWTEVLSSVGRGVPSRFKMQLSGMLRPEQGKLKAELDRTLTYPNTLNYGNHWNRAYDAAETFGLSRTQEGVQQLSALLATPEGQAREREVIPSLPIELKAEEWWNEASGALHENLPPVRPQSMKYYAAGTLEALINMGPAVAATIATKNPQVGATIMGTQVYGETYGNMLDRGYNSDQAAAAALYSAAIETLTERIPLGILTRGNYSGLKKILLAAGAESVQESITEAMQIGYDLKILNDDMTAGEAMWRLVDAGVMGFGAGAGMGGISAAVDQLRTPAGQEFAAEQGGLERMAERIEERVAAEEERGTRADELVELELARDGRPLSPEQLQRLANDGLIKVDDVSRGELTDDLADPTTAAAGEVPEGRDPQRRRGEGGQEAAPRAVILPAGRRRLTTLHNELEAARTTQALAASGVGQAELAPTRELLQRPAAQERAAAETNATPTPAQIEAGNYRKGRFEWMGQRIAIETPAGSTRSGTGPNGEQWSQTMTVDYGYFPSRPGADDTGKGPTEGVDAYVGPDTNYPIAVVVNQTNPDGSFDEHKVMVGFRSPVQAIEAYRENHAPARGREIDYVTMPPDQFKRWLNEDDHTEPATRAAPMFHVSDDTYPTRERYNLRGTRPVGAPPAVKTLEQVDKQIDDFVSVLEDSKLIPEQAWTWYEDSGAAIRDVTQGDVARMNDVVKVLAVLSQASGVATNTGAMVKAAYEIARGNKSPKVGRYPNAMAKNIETVLNADEITADLPGIGDKLASFYRNLYDATFNTRKYDQDVTIDRWMARIMNYRGDTVLGTQYNYARKVFNDAVRRFNQRNGTSWLPRNAQAALWVHERSRTSVEKGGKVMPVDAFSTYLDATKARVIHEAVPSTSTEAGRVIANLDTESKSDFTRRAIGHYFQGDKNLLLEEMGIPLYNRGTGSGGYESRISPNEISNVVMIKGSEGYDRETADAVARAYMLMHQQDGVPWFRADRNANVNSKKHSQGVEFEFEGELTPQQEERFFKELQIELGMFAGYTRMAPNKIAIVDFKDERGRTTSKMSPEEFVDVMERIGGRLKSDLGVTSLRTFGAEGNYLTHDWNADPEGKALEQEIEKYARARKRPDLLERIRGWREQIGRTTADYAARASRQRSVAAPVPVDRLDGGSETEFEIYGRFGQLNRGTDTTNKLKFYELGRLVDDPTLTTNMLTDLGFRAEVFSFNPENFRIPKLGKENYENGVVWIYDPSAAHGSFKDTNYTKAWRETHEAGHGVVEPLLARKYGPSRRYGRLGQTMQGERGAPPKRIKVELKPLTLLQAQRSVEWEDVAFRAQRMLLEDLGIQIDDATFGREYNTNISDAMYRVVTGDFGNPGEIGFVPSKDRVDVRDVLEALQLTEEEIAAEQGRPPTKGIDLEHWQPVSDEQIRASIEARRSRKRKPIAHVTESVIVPRAVKLTPAQRAIEDNMAAIVASVELAAEEYARLRDSAGGTVLNTDVARELSPDYLADRTQSAAVHEPASWFIKELYVRKLREPPPPGKTNNVLFTGGGTGAGKSTGIESLAEAKGAVAEAQIVYDSNLNNLETSTRRIEQALAAGKTVSIIYTYRDPVDAFVNGTLARSMRQERQFGSGRTVNLEIHAETHVEGFQTIREIEDRYQNDPRVSVRVIDNSRGRGNAVMLRSIREVRGRPPEYNSLVRKLYEELDQQYRSGTVSTAVYEATGGRRARAQDREDGRRDRQESQQEARARLAPVSTKLVRAIAQEFHAAFPSAPRVRIAGDVAELPAEYRDVLPVDGPTVNGFFVAGREGAEIWVIANRVKNAREALEIMLHEGVGHYGLKSVLGADYTPTMQRIIKAMPDRVRAAARRNGLDVTDEYERLLAAEEVVAYAAGEVLLTQKFPKSQGFLEQIIDAIKVAIARLRGVQFTDVEILRLIRKARMFTAAPWGAKLGQERVESPPVLLARFWRALNSDRVPDVGDYKMWGAEIQAQIRAGNITKDDAAPLIDFVTSRDGTFTKLELMELVKERGNAEAMFHVEYDGRREAILNGDLDDGFTLEEGSKSKRLWNLLVYKAQDKFIDLLNVQRAIEQQSERKLPDDLDAYLQEELFHGRVKDRIDRYGVEHIEPLVKAMHESGYTWDEVEWYLYARHAPEANQHLYKINWGTPEMIRRRDRAKVRSQAKFERREQRLEGQRAKVRVRLEDEHQSNVRVAESEYRSQIRRSKPSQKARRAEIEATKARKIERSAERLKLAIDALEGRQKLQRDEFRSIFGAELEQADLDLTEAARERAQEDPGLLALSGMSDAEAGDIMDVLREKGGMAKLEAIGERIDRMTAANRTAMVEAGLETGETIKAWEATYDHYVPLKGWKDGAGNTTFFPKKGKGFDTGGRLQQRRLGRRTLAANILANIVAQAQSTSIMAEKAKVGRAMLELVRAHPNPDLWKVDVVESKRFINKKTGLVTTGVDPTYQLRDNVFRVKVDGKDHLITLNEENDVSARMAKSLKNMSAQEINWFFSTLLGLNRILSAVNTAYNPEFVLSNFIRDLQTAAVNLTSTEADAVKKQIFRDIFKAHTGIRSGLGLIGASKSKIANEWREHFEEYKRAGAAIGWLDNYRDVVELESVLKREMNKRDAGLVSWNTVDKMKRVIEGENQAIENAIRLSTFVHARKLGLSVSRAASLARNLTVNFNRKGEIGTAMNALYLFYNASIQGMAVMWKASKNPKTRAIMYGIVAFAAALDIINRMMGGQDDDGEWRYDKVPEYVKERNLILMLPESFQPKTGRFDDYYISLPLPYGYNFLHTIGRTIGGGFDYYGIGNKRRFDGIEEIGKITNAALNAFNPVGTGPTVLQTVAPTVFTPLVQSSENVSWYGGPIVPPVDPWDPSQEPDSQRYYASARAHSVALAEFLNELGGGSEARPARVPFLDVSPETIELWEDFLTGGSGRFVSNMVEVGVMVKDQKVETKNIPFLRRVIGKNDRRAVSDTFFAAQEEISYAEDELKVAMNAVSISRDDAERLDARANLERIQERYRDEIALIEVMKVIKTNLRDLNLLRNTVRDSDRPNKETEVENIELKKAELMNQFNRRYNELKDRSRDRPLLDRILPFIAGATNRTEATDSLRDAGLPATAELIQALPAQLNQQQRATLEAAQ